MLLFLFLFACMRFVLFVRVKSSCKKKIKKFKIAVMASSTILLKSTPKKFLSVKLMALCLCLILIIYAPV